MDAALKEWLLSRGVAEKTVSILEKEEIVSIDVITRLTEEDLTALKNDHGLTLGEHVRLRESRDAILRGEYPYPSPTSKTEGSDAAVTEREENREAVERGAEPVLLAQRARGEAGEEGRLRDGKQKNQNRSKSQSTPAPKPTSHAQSHADKYGELKERAVVVEKLHQQGDLQGATQGTQALAKDAQNLVEEIREETAAPVGDLRPIGDVAEAFDRGSRSGLCPCCTLL